MAKILTDNWHLDPPIQTLEYESHWLGLKVVENRKGYFISITRYDKSKHIIQETVSFSDKAKRKRILITGNLWPRAIVN